MKTRLLLVDDDAIQSRLLGELLSDTYEVAHVPSGEACLERLAEWVPALVLMDVMMPGIDGYETCHRVHEIEGMENLPVVFLSAAIEMNDRLAGYAAGGHDYLTKPVQIQELKSKLAIILNEMQAIEGLRAQAGDAFKTAMMAMSSAAEMGIVMQAMRESFSCQRYQALADIVVKAVNQFGLDCSVQVRGDFGHVSQTAVGPCTPLECTVLTNMAQQDRIVDLGSHTAINFSGLSLIVKNMPRDDVERYGRLKDSLAFLVEGLDARVHALDAELRQQRQHEVVTGLVPQLTEALAKIEGGCQDYRTKLNNIIFNLDDSIRKTVGVFGLNENQYELIASFIQGAITDVEALSGQRPQINPALMSMLRELGQSG